jgi:hypothetical protein
MQYAKMVELLELAKTAGDIEFDTNIRDGMQDCFQTWLRDCDIKDYSDEEYEALYEAYRKGYGIAAIRDFKKERK